MGYLTGLLRVFLLVVFFLFTDLFALLCLALMAHLALVPTSLHDISGPTAFWSAAWLPAMLLGIWLGHRQSARITPIRCNLTSVGGLILHA